MCIVKSAIHKFVLMIKAVLAYTHPVYKHLFIPPGSKDVLYGTNSSSFNSPMKVGKALIDKQQNQLWLLTLPLLPFLSDPTGLVTVHVSAWLHLCKDIHPIGLYLTEC